jgi:ubiquinone/menaquinone biosynthesis C-methylase UbiE
MNTSPYSFQKLFDEVAPMYEARIIQAFGPMAQNLVAWIAQQNPRLVLDVGTGSGIMARCLSPMCQNIIGVDFSAVMVQVAQTVCFQERLDNVHFVQGDAHHLSFADNSFDLVVSSFGFNATDPRRSLAEARRVLAPGGELCFQEWGATHPFDEIIHTAIAEYSLDDEDAPDELIAMRDFYAEERPWYRDLQNEEDYFIDLETLGFTDIQVKEHQPVQVSLPLDGFISYKTAWAGPRFELDAMEASTRQDCLDNLRGQLTEFADTQGYITYDPALFRVRARKSEGHFTR